MLILEVVGFLDQIITPIHRAVQQIQPMAVFLARQAILVAATQANQLVEGYSVHKIMPASQHLVEGYLEIMQTVLLLMPVEDYLAVLMLILTILQQILVEGYLERQEILQILEGVYLALIMLIIILPLVTQVLLVVCLEINQHRVVDYLDHPIMHLTLGVVSLVLIILLALQGVDYLDLITMLQPIRIKEAVAYLALLQVTHNNPQILSNKEVYLDKIQPTINNHHLAGVIRIKVPIKIRYSIRQISLITQILTILARL
mmetsp:Transcript_3158/g.3538  ORF Transcript_3158/g.3538 Transcript_3158/m.3538 type:complete len:259 (-) Transcript_3158:726-1502(-)